jgi:hypothetical protein
MGLSPFTGVKIQIVAITLFDYYMSKTDTSTTVQNLPDLSALCCGFSPLYFARWGRHRALPSKSRPAAAGNAAETDLWAPGGRPRRGGTAGVGEEAPV